MQALVVHACLFIPGLIPGLNEILDARGSVSALFDGGKKRANRWATTKKRWMHTVQLIAQSKGIRSIPSSAFTFLHHEPGRSRNPDNFCAGAQKIILDAFVDRRCRILRNDGWGDVLDLRHHWIVAKERVGVTIWAASRALEKHEALAIDPTLGKGQDVYATRSRASDRVAP